MGYNTKIDWCDTSWNPLSGCYHNCEYCYARGIASRFDGKADRRPYPQAEGEPVKFDLEWPVRRDGRILAYPFGFAPTFHRYRLDMPQKWTTPRTIFVCSMADLFGAWVPDEWISTVLDACRKAPQHRYMFLTKNPDRYDMLEDAGIITPADKNFWLGSTTTDINCDRLHWDIVLHTFQSCEPMLAPWLPVWAPNEAFRGIWPEWVIFGAETGTRKDKVIPEKWWVDNAVKMCRNMGAKVFMKESLRGIMGSDFIQEFPW